MGFWLARFMSRSLLSCIFLPLQCNVSFSLADFKVYTGLSTVWFLSVYLLVFFLVTHPAHVSKLLGSVIHSFHYTWLNYFLKTLLLSLYFKYTFKNNLSPLSNTTLLSQVRVPHNIISKSLSSLVTLLPFILFIHVI